MPLTVKLTPGKVVTETDLWTVALLNLIANPTIELEGTIGSSSLTANAINNLSFIADGLFSNPAGRAKFANEFVNNLLLSGSGGGPPALSADSTGRGIMADGFVTWPKLSDDARSMGRAPGWAYNSLVVQTNAATPLSKVDVTAVDLVLMNASSVPLTYSGTLTGIDITVGGAGGLDTGSEAASTWYYIWVIGNATVPTAVTFAGLLSTSATYGGLTLPAGYTFAARVGAVRNGPPKGTTTDFMPFHQIRNRVWLPEYSLFNIDPRTGTTTYAILGGPDLTNFQAAVAPTAVMVYGAMGTLLAAAHAMAIAATNADGTLADGTASKPIMGANYLCLGGQNLVSNENYGNFRVPIRTTLPTLPNIQWKSESASTIYKLIVNGFEF